jgi:hypothetical protein
MSIDVGHVGWISRELQRRRVLRRLSLVGSRLGVVVILGLASTAGARPGDGDIVFTAGEFDRGSFEVVTVSTAAGGSSAWTQQPAGGNPGAFLRITHSLDAGPPDGGYCANWAWVFVFPSGATIDPAAIGGIESVDFSIDSLYLASEPTPLLPQSRGVALRQGGRIYLGASNAVGPSGWTTLTFFDLASAQFSELVNLPPCDFTDNQSQPDFSPSGGQIEFGFASGNSTSIGGNQFSMQIAYGVDNWSVTVVSAPPPACLGDLDGNRVVDASDLAILLGQWSGTGAADLDGSGLVDAADLAILLGAWGPC